jgi:hypothetical protein
VSVSVLKPYRHRPGVDPGVHVEGELEFQVDQITHHHLLRSRRNIPAVAEFRIRWIDNAEDSWHEPCDVEHAQDVLVEYLERLKKHARVAVLKAFDPISLSRLPERLQALIPT